jgi:hypothetical protein
MNTRHACVLVCQFVICLTSIAALAVRADAAVIFNVLINPPSTAGGGATSTRSGLGSWHLYAIDDNADDFGISLYSVTMVNATAINHRSPVTNINDSNGDPQTAGFTLLRSATNANPIHAAQNFPDQTPFLIKGFGQTTGNFCDVAGGACVAVIGPTTSTSWGTYTNVSPYNGKHWLFIAEGLFNPPGPLPAIAAATVTVYNADFSSKFSPSIVPEPCATSLVGLALVGLSGFARRQPLRRYGIIGFNCVDDRRHFG